MRDGVIGMVGENVGLYEEAVADDVTAGEIAGMIAVPVEQRDISGLPDQRSMVGEIGGYAGHGDCEGYVAGLQPLDEAFRPQGVVGWEEDDFKTEGGEFLREQFQQATERIVGAFCPA